MPKGVYKKTKQHGINLSKSLTGNKLSKETKDKISKTLMGRYENENNPVWKGDDASYAAKHMWIYQRKGKASKCELKDDTCKGEFQWSNISREYKRDVNDFWELCISHHVRFDMKKRLKK